MRDNSAFLCCAGKYLFLKQSFIICVRSNAVVSEVFWHISVLILNPGFFLVLMCLCISLCRISPRHSLPIGNLSPATASSSSRNKLFIISSTVSCQSVVMDPSVFLMVDVMLPVFSLFAIILYVMNHGLSFMFSSTYFFQVFFLAVRIAVLYLWRQFPKAFCTLSLASKSSVFFSLLLYRFVCFFIFARSEVHHVLISFLRRFSQSVCRRLYADSLFNFTCCRSVLVSKSNWWIWCYHWSHSAPFSSLSFCPWAFLLALWYRYWIYCLCIPDMSTVVRAYLLFGVRDFLDNFSLLICEWREPQALFCIYICTLCCVSSLVNACCSTWIYDPLSDRWIDVTTSVLCQYWLMT